MLRALAAFLAVGFFSSAAFLAAPDEPPKLRSFDGEEALENRTHGAFLLAIDPLACAPAQRPDAGVTPIRPRRFDEVVDDRVVLEVVREDGRPIVGAAVFGAFDGIPLEATTDAEGRARLRSFEDATADITVSGRDFRWEVRQIRLDPGPQRFVIPTRSSFVGKVRVRGQVPSAPVEIGLACQGGWMPSARSDEHGSIEIFNMPADWSGSLIPPLGHRRALAGSTFATPRSAAYSSRPFSDQGPSTGVRITNAAIIGVPGDIEVGTFLNPADVVTDSPRGTAVPATFSNPAGVPAFEQPGYTVVDVLEWRPGFGVHDAGIIELVPTREIKLRVLDESGAAITRAQAQIFSGFELQLGVPSLGSTIVFNVDESTTADEVRASLQVCVPPASNNRFGRWLAVDVMTESGKDDFTVTVR